MMNAPKRQERIQIKNAYEHMTPSEAAKNRMYQRILEQAALTDGRQTERQMDARPVWYVRFKAPLGIAASAACCVLLFMAALGNPLFENPDGTRQALLQTAVNDTVIETKPAVTTCTTRQESIIQTAVDSERLETETTAVSTAKTVTTVKNQQTHTETLSGIAATQPVPGTSAPQGDGSGITTVTSVAVTETTAPEELPEMTTSVGTSDTGIRPIVPQTTTVTESPVPEEKPTETTSTSSCVTFYGNMYDFDCPVWNASPYRTDFTQIDLSMVGEYLGSSAAYDQQGKCHTILVYELAGTSVDDAIVVQYINEFNYYAAYRS